MIWVILYDIPNTSEQFEVSLSPISDVIDSTYPTATKSSSNITWKGEYTTEDNGHCKLTVEHRQYMFLFYTTLPLGPFTYSAQIVILNGKTYLEEFEKLVSKFGLNTTESNDMVTNWTIEMSQSKYTALTLFDNSVDTFIPLSVKGFTQKHRVLIGIESINQEQLDSLRSQNKISQIDDIQQRVRPTGKYVVEWGGVETHFY
ncbi:hypothetical protein EIN_108580 [Entamoeba invadens IP1]|uniref:Uncharacterized protein n=1 Tax=Entamoeba invadens IP1 TaxID=370355 RepID=L7FPK6_ENTIV|nr:hypothetical protein EIN_108580 [Entamoeba invadens IP1]ELP94696.1 hypothetical protein EIN_108580 [Entamoeba invadens IP1]|eukprot:XP_004261467.1 hypothetical protein EIN_108580 [Entamoeba invadens IP1]